MGAATPCESLERRGSCMEKNPSHSGFKWKHNRATMTLYANLDECVNFIVGGVSQ
jgi:NAD-dependent dihydropyrimidine dehydrogenase PreA subunit